MPTFSPPPPGFVYFTFIAYFLLSFFFFSLSGWLVPFRFQLAIHVILFRSFSLSFSPGFSLSLSLSLSPPFSIAGSLSLSLSLSLASFLSLSFSLSLSFWFPSLSLTLYLPFLVLCRPLSSFSGFLSLSFISCYLSSFHSFLFLVPHGFSLLLSFYLTLTLPLSLSLPFGLFYFSGCLFLVFPSRGHSGYLSLSFLSILLLLTRCCSLFPLGFLFVLSLSLCLSDGLVCFPLRSLPGSFVPRGPVGVALLIS